MEDTDQPTDTELREIVRDELEQMLDEQDDEEPTYSRRQVAKALGLAGTAGLAGVGGMNAATETASAGTQSVGAVGSASNPVDVEAEDINATAIDTDQLNTVRYVSATDSNLQSIVNEVDTAGGGVVYLEAGLHDSHGYPVTVPSGVSLEGPNMGSASPGGDVLPAVLDASGGVALDCGAGETTAKAITLRNFAVMSGTVRFSATTNRDFLVENIYVEGADSAAASGRGIEILNEAYLYTIRNVHAEQCDGYGYYSEHGGQVLVDGVRAFDCGATVDGGQIYLSDAGGGGGEGEYRRLVAGIGSGTANAQHGIVLDRLYGADLYSPQAEKTDYGIYFDGATGDTKGVKIYGGRIVNNNNGIRGGDSTNYAYGTLLHGVGFDATTNADIHLGSNAYRWHIGPCLEDSASQQIGGFSVSNSGWECTIDPANYFTRHATGQDLSVVAPVFANERRIHDGTGNMPRGPAVANTNNPSVTTDWVSLIDGTSPL